MVTKHKLKISTSTLWKRYNCVIPHSILTWSISLRFLQRKSVKFNTISTVFNNELFHFGHLLNTLSQLAYARNLLNFPSFLRKLKKRSPTNKKPNAFAGPLLTGANTILKNAHHFTNLPLSLSLSLFISLSFSVSLSLSLSLSFNFSFSLSVSFLSLSYVDYWRKISCTQV